MAESKPSSQRPERQGQGWHALHVGKPYDPHRGSWPEGADYNFCLGAHELRIFLRAAARAEVEAVQSGPVEFGFFAEPPGLMLVARFGRSLSYDCSYSWHRMAEATGDRTLPPASEETSPTLRALLTIILIEATDGVVLVLRTVTFSPEFTRALHRAISDQAAGPYDRAEHLHWAGSMTAWNFTEQLWERCTMRCQGGA
jgi:hypothetical protein